MAKFRFRLATLQRLRESHRDEMRSKLAEAYAAERTLEEQVLAIHAEEEDLRVIHKRCLETSSPDVNRLLDVQRYSASLKGRLSTLKSQNQVLATEIEKRRQALVEADQQVRVLEKLHDRQLATHRDQERTAEAKSLDEIASLRREDEI